MVSERLEDEAQVCNPPWDLLGRLQLLHDLKCDQEEDEEAEEDPEPDWLAPVYCFQLPARRQIFQTISRQKKCVRVRQGGKRP